MRQTKTRVQLRGEYVEYIPSLVDVACFLAGRANDLSAPPSYLYNMLAIMCLHNVLQVSHYKCTRLFYLCNKMTRFYAQKLQVVDGRLGCMLT